jgi:hypothetical protein
VVVEGGRSIADGVELLADLATIQITRVRTARQQHAYDRLASYYALEGDLVLDDVTTPAGSWLQVPPSIGHTVEGVFLRVLT